VLVAGLAVVMLVDVIPRIREQARANTARGTVANLQLALIAYRYDFDRYPPSGHDSLVRYLDGDPSNGGPNKGYFPFVASLVTDELHYLDPWGRPYTYSASNAPDDATCEITSSGPLDSPSASVITWLWGRIARTTDETPATDTAQD
jgi:type II secretory pathway pseudopilin PulG